jgi:hypothetical protein
MKRLNLFLSPISQTRTANLHMTRSILAWVVVVLALLMLAAGDAVAAETLPSVTGSWKLATSTDQESQRLEAIDNATKDLRRMQRGRARDLLEKRTSPPQSLEIEIEGSMVTIGSGEREIELELGGTPIEVAGDQGKAQMSATMEGDRLIVVADGGKGGRTTTYSADGDRLSVEVTMTGAMLAAPLTYVATYARAE